MKIEKSVLITNGIFLALGILISATSSFESSVVGLIAVLMGFLNFVLLVIYSITGNRNAMLNALILAGVLFTIGFSVCSSGPGFNMH
jgi:hypothetical protein